MTRKTRLLVVLIPLAFIVCLTLRWTWPLLAILGGVAVLMFLFTFTFSITIWVAEGKWQWFWEEF